MISEHFVDLAKLQTEVLRESRNPKTEPANYVVILQMLKKKSTGEKNQK